MASPGGGFVPDGGRLETVVNMLKQAESSDREAQLRIVGDLKRFGKDPQFCCYLCHIYVNGSHLPLSMRFQAGVQLKNNLDRYWPIADRALEFVQAEIVKMIGVDKRPLRLTAANVASTICRRGCDDKRNIFQSWKSLIPGIGKILTNRESHPDALHGTLLILKQLCVDVPYHLDSDSVGRPLNNIVPVLISYMSHGIAEMRQLAATAMMNLLLGDHFAVSNKAREYIAALAKLTTDPDPKVKKIVVDSLTLLIERYTAQTVPVIDHVIAFILSACESDDETISVPAMEFFNTFARVDDDAFEGKLEPHMERIVKALVKGIHLRPVQAENLLNAKPEARELKPDDEEEDNDEEEWGIRKASLAAASDLALYYPQAMFDQAKKYIHAVLEESREWQIRECACALFGSISRGLRDRLTGLLSSFFPALLRQAQDPHPLVRSIVCWVLGKLSRWVVSDKGRMEKWLKPTMDAIIGNIGHKLQRTRIYACAALATIIEEGEDALLPYMEMIVTTSAKALENYQMYDVPHILDAIGSLFTTLPSQCRAPPVKEALVPLCFKKCWSLDNNSPWLVFFMETFMSIAQALGPEISPIAKPLITRITTIMEDQLLYLKHCEDSHEPPPSLGILVSVLDAAGGLANGLGPSFATLLPDGPQFTSLIVETAKLSSTSVRTSSYALLGDMAPTCFPLLRPHVPKLIEYMCQVVPSYESHENCSNNAVWAMSQLIKGCGDSIAPVVPNLLKIVGPVITPDTSPVITQSAVACIGRMCAIMPNVCAPHTKVFYRDFVRAANMALDPGELTEIFVGLSRVIIVRAKNPEIPKIERMEDRRSFFTAVAHMQAAYATPEVRKEIGEAISEVRRIAGPEFGELMGSLAERDARTLADRFGDVCRP